MFRYRHYRNPKDYGRVLWQSVLDQPSMVTGEGDYPWLAEWDIGNTLGTSNVDSNDAGASAVRALVLAGPDAGYAMYNRTITTTTDQAATRTFRNTESITNMPLYYYCEYAFLAAVTVSGFLNIDEWKSRIEPAGTNKVSWNLGVVNPSGSNMALRLGFNTDMDTGPFPGTTGGVPYFFNQVTPVLIPVLQWFSIEVYLKPSETFNGEIAVWQTVLGEAPVPLIWDIGGTATHRVHGIRTNQAGGLQTWAITNYARNNSTIEILQAKAAISTAPIANTSRQPKRNLSLCYVTKDGWNTKANPNTANGTSAVIRCRSIAGANAKVGMMRFDMAHLAGRTASGDGTLDLYNSTVVAAGRSFALHRMIANSGWVEGFTWNYAVPSTVRFAGDTDNNGGDNAGGSVAGTDYETTAFATFSYTSSSAADTLHRVAVPQATLQAGITAGYLDVTLLCSNDNDFDFRSSNYDTDPRKRPMLTVPLVG